MNKAQITHFTFTEPRAKHRKAHEPRAKHRKAHEHIMIFINTFINLKTKAETVDSLGVCIVFIFLPKPKKLFTPLCPYFFIMRYWTLISPFSVLPSQSWFDTSTSMIDKGANVKDKKEKAIWDREWD